MNPHDILTAMPENNGLIAAAAAFSYLVLLVVARWNLVARPTRHGVMAQVEDTRSLVRIEHADLCEADIPYKQALDEADQLLQKAEALVARWRFWDMAMWSRGQELAAWQLVHRARILLVYVTDIDRVRARLEVACAQLSEAGCAEATRLAAAAEAALADPTTSDRRLRATLQEALSAIYTHNDDCFAEYANWHNRSMWFVLSALFLVSLLACARGNAALLLMGAAGGLLSRLMRALKAQDVTHDYGASWTTLFLSPVAGALAGWCGVLLLTLLGPDQLGVIGGTAAGQLRWGPYPLTEDPSSLLLALALLLGFSERRFSQVVETLEGRMGQDPGGPAQLPPALPPPAAPPAIPRAPAPPDPEHDPSPFAAPARPHRGLGSLVPDSRDP